MMIRFIVLIGVLAALAAVLWLDYPTFPGLPDASPREANCKVVKERANIQAGLSRLHAIDESLAKLKVEHARTKKLNARTPADLGGLTRAVEEQQRDLSNEKTSLLRGVPCLADVYGAEQH
jgi:hypothetical protein